MTPASSFLAGITDRLSAVEQSKIKLGVWSPLYEPAVGGRVNAMIVSPHDSARVLVSGDMLGVSVSEDGGESWQAAIGLPAYEMGSFTWHPYNPKVVWCGSMSGPVKSVDGGHTWTSKRTGLPASAGFPYTAPVEKILFDPADAKHMLAFAGSHRSWKAAGSSGALNYGLVYESTDGGENWTTKSTVATDGNIFDATVMGTASMAKIAVTVNASGASSGVWVSTDGGTTWAARNTGLPHISVFRIIGDSNANTLTVSLGSSPSGSPRTPGGIYRSTDTGTNWALLGTGLPQVSNADGNNASRFDALTRTSDGDLYTADLNFTAGKKWRLPNGTSVWEQLGDVPRAFPASDSPYFFAADPHDPNVLYGGTSDTLMKTKDGGVTWQDQGSRRVIGGWRGRGYSGLLGMSVALSQFKRNRAILCSFDAGNVVVSDDMHSWNFPTRTWDSYTGGQDARWATADIGYVILGQAGIFNGVGVTTDGGKTWSFAAGAPLPAKGASSSTGAHYAVCPITDDGSRCLAVLPQGTVFRTTDTGASWQLNFNASVARWAAAAPDFSRLYLATTAGVYVSTNGGTDWTLLTGTPSFTRIKVDPNNYNILYAMGYRTGSSGLWRSEDAGVTWTKLVSDSLVSDIAIDPTNSNHLVYSTSDLPYHDIDFASGVYRSTDYARSWSPLSTGLRNKRVETIRFDPWDPTHLVAGTYGSGFIECYLPPADTGDLLVLPSTAQFVVPYPAWLLGVLPTVTPKPTADVTVDVFKNGQSIFSIPTDRPKVSAGATVTSEKMPAGVSLDTGDVITLDPRDPVTGTPNVTYVGKTDVNSSDGQTLTFARPAGSAVNDIHLIIIESVLTGVSARQIDAPAFWTYETGTRFVDSAVDIYWARDTGSSGWPYIFDFTPLQSSFKYKGTVITYRNVPTTNKPIDAVTLGGNTFDTPLAVPSASVPTTGDKILTAVTASIGVTFALPGSPARTIRRGVTSADYLHLIEDDAAASQGVIPAWAATFVQAVYSAVAVIAIRGVDAAVHDKSTVSAALRTRRK